jgi:hypothetical protein
VSGATARAVAQACALGIAIGLCSILIAASSSCGAVGSDVGRSLLGALPDVISLAQRICYPGEPHESCLAKCQQCARDQANDAGTPAPSGSVP